jgi:hypothetical protein
MLTIRATQSSSRYAKSGRQGRRKKKFVASKERSVRAKKLLAMEMQALPASLVDQA